MKILPENKKKTYIYLGVLIVAAVATFFVINRSGQGGEEAAPPAEDLISSSALKNILPYGKQIDLRLLDSEKFKLLRPVPTLSITSDELGKENLFTP